ncbi:MAG: 2,3-bisphosphoglycerate-independent phosphoglycerate mutase [Planctomycetota bacterium]
MSPTNVHPANTPCILIIRDGWGENPNPEHDSFNAIKIANTPVAERLMAGYPNTLIGTSGEDVGLPDGTMGNSEVGHQNIGAGRIVDQEAVRITKACRAGLSDHPVLAPAVSEAKNAGRAVHLMGICSDAGVHGMLEHLYALLDLCKHGGQDRVFIHLFTDGRDTGPFTGKGYAEQVEARCAEIGVGRVASVVGRYWAMDRDNRWERVRRAYDCLTRGTDAEGTELPNFGSGAEAIAAYYDAPEGGETLKGDEFVSPRTVGDAADSRIASGDTVIFYNYRGDRPRELCSAFLLPEFHGSDELKPSPDSSELGFHRGEKLGLRFVLMSPYSERLAELADVAFPRPPKMEDIGGAYLAKLGLRQFRCAETEKFPHVTFFFNDYRDDPFEGETREIIQSPKVATYDLSPQMSARGVCDAVLRRLDADDCEDVIVVNFANGDMVGHTGSLDAAVKACETVDSCVGEIVERALKRGGSGIVTADHGNAEQMWNPEADSPHTAHTTYTVPAIVIGERFEGRSLRADGRLGDLLPTMLDMMGLDSPGAMTGSSLLV